LPGVTKRTPPPKEIVGGKCLVGRSSRRANLGTKVSGKKDYFEEAKNRILQ